MFVIVSKLKTSGSSYAWRHSAHAPQHSSIPALSCLLFLLLLTWRDCYN